MQFVVHKKSTQKQLATERIARQQKDREMECNAAITFDGMQVPNGWLVIFVCCSNKLYKTHKTKDMCTRRGPGVLY